jgi:hypothetical protein
MATTVKIALNFSKIVREKGKILIEFSIFCEKNL